MGVLQRLARPGRCQVRRRLEGLVRLFQVILRQIPISQRGIGVAGFGIEFDGIFEEDFRGFEVALAKRKRPQSHFQRGGVTGLRQFLEALAGFGDLIGRGGFGQQDWGLRILGVFIKDEDGLVPRFFQPSGSEINRAQLQAHLKVVGGQLLCPNQNLGGFPNAALIVINDTEAAPCLGVLLVVPQNIFILDGRLVILAGIEITVRPPQMIGRLHLGGATGARDGREHDQGQRWN